MEVTTLKDLGVDVSIILKLILCVRACVRACVCVDWIHLAKNTVHGEIL
jgi:hypothetical protein